MSLPYAVLGQFTGSIESGSFLDSNDTSLFYVSQSSDIWFGFSTNDVIEISAFSTDDKSPLGWGILEQTKTFQTVTLTYLDNLNVPNTYSYNELVNPYTFYKNNSILLQPASDLASIGITEGNYEVSYNFVREMAGNIVAPLTIKDISPSRTEVKLIPSNGLGDVQYNSFYLKKFPIRDAASLLLSVSKNLSYDSIFRTMNALPQYQDGISFLKFAFFLTDDGSIINFIKNLYEDFITYTVLGAAITPGGLPPSIITRVQGIKTYYNNYLLQNYESIANFDDIRNQFIGFVNLRLDERFVQLLNSQDQGYTDARQFVYDFFVTYFYDAKVTPLQESYEAKYFDYFKNVLNFGNNRYFSILDHGFLDERQSSTDPITLIVKLSAALPSDIVIKDTCWVSNNGMAPYVFTTLLQNPVKHQTVKIAGPNFASPQNLINKEQSNVLYSSDDLANAPTTANDIRVNKNIAELNTDYTKYSNFVVFSSAAARLNIFKNKMIQWTALSASLVQLDARYSASLSSLIPYPYFFSEQASFQTQISTIVNSFDGFESYLFNNQKYLFNYTSGSFVSASYVADEDIRATTYDAANRDSLNSNVPQYVALDSNYSDYITFLNMVGHHFDNIYTYVSAMPIERQVRNQLSASIPVNTLKELLYSFGWNVDDTIGSMNLDEVYLNSMNSASYNALSGQERLQTIWNRILVTLPGIYKTKGTLECVNFLMSCYGLPSSLISIREYGGTDFAEDTTPTYILDEKTYMLQYSGIGDYIEGPIPDSTQTVEFKFSLNQDTNDQIYPDYKYFPLFTSIPYPYTSSANNNWSVGFYRVPGQFTGHVAFQMGSGSSGAFITSSVLPIFNGEIFSVMVRRNNPNALFEPDTLDNNAIPLDYDLVVQRNDNGRQIFYSSSSIVLYDADNDVFSQFGRFRLSNGNLVGTLDKLSIWSVPISDNDFDEHANDLNSYGYSGSFAYQDLWVRLSWDYPQNMYSSSGKVWVDNRSAHYAIPNYYTDGTLTTVNPTLYSASVSIRNNVWLGFYPTGSTDIIAYNFPQAIGSAFSASFIGVPTCQWFSQSIYPYHFEELTYQQELDASKFGPTKYKNNKIRKIDYQLNARLDPFNRSTSQPEITVSGESNQLGFFIDPQDSKNKDIIRYVGKSGVMQLIGDPNNLYSDKYYDLINKNYEYNTNGNKKTYFNELLTIYKFYFDKSIFQAIKNVLPARANAYTGVVIEPTVLERPKYQNRPITSSIIPTYQTPGIIQNIYTFETDAVWANFNTDWSLIKTGSLPPTFTNYQSLLDFYQNPPTPNPSNINSLPPLQQTNAQLSMSNSLPPSYQCVFDLTYVENPVRAYPANLDDGYYTDSLDNIQHNFFPDFENLPRLWETSSTGPLPPSYTRPIYGSVSYNNNINSQNRLMIGPDEGVNYPNLFFSGSNRGNHPIIYYMLKVWDKYNYYSKTGEYFHTDSPVENQYASASYYLYKYIIVNEYYMRNLVYFTDEVLLPVYDSSSMSYTYDAGTNSYLHHVNTFLKTPDQTVSNISASANANTPSYKILFDLNIRPGTQFFELARGYPRNHYTHKMQQFSVNKHGTSNRGLYIKGQNSTFTTINEQGINDGSYPVISSNTSNVNIVNTTTVIQNVVSPSSGQVTPTTTNAVSQSMANNLSVNTTQAKALLHQIKADNDKKVRTSRLF